MCLMSQKKIKTLSIKMYYNRLLLSHLFMKQKRDAMKLSPLHTFSNKSSCSSTLTQFACLLLLLMKFMSRFIGNLSSLNVWQSNIYAFNLWSHISGSKTIHWFLVSLVKRRISCMLLRSVDERESRRRENKKSVSDLPLIYTSIFQY